VAPIKPEHGWEEIKEFARGFAETMAREIHDAYVANMSKKRRSGKIFVDFFRLFSDRDCAVFAARARGRACCLAYHLDRSKEIYKGECNPDQQC